MALTLFVYCAFMCTWVSCHADAPTAWQMGFQDPATKAMMGIVDLHHDICFFLINILVMVLWVGARILHAFHHTKMSIPERFNHHTNLELVWAILPSLIVTLIALPSLTLIYSFDDLAADPFVTVKIIGYQWAWKYELKEHVRHSLIDADSLLSYKQICIYF
jgi:cytochrome c oxidase subunit 2